MDFWDHHNLHICYTWVGAVTTTKVIVQQLNCKNHHKLAVFYDRVGMIFTFSFTMKTRLLESRVISFVLYT